MVVKSETQNIEEDTKSGIKKKYTSEEQSSYGESWVFGVRWGQSKGGVGGGDKLQSWIRFRRFLLAVRAC